MAKIDLSVFNKFVEDKVISVQKHPTEDLLIWNYTEKAQYDRIWTPETMMARGLITDLEGNIKARPFTKFFNLEEHQVDLPAEDFEVTEKMDGSLGILYWVGKEPCIATRGSFVSDQAAHGTQVLYSKYLNSSSFRPQWTYLFEIIYPTNRIVVDYKGLDDLVLLAIIDTETGSEIPPMILSEPLSMPWVKKYDGLTDVKKLKELSEDNREGYVVHFKSGLRLKVKFDEYVRLHRLITGVNAKSIWELLRNNQPFDELLERVPNEFYDWVKQTKADLEARYAHWEYAAKLVYSEAIKFPTRKEQAMFLQEYNTRAIVFKMLDNQPYNEIIWKLVKPVAEKPFKKDIDA